MGLMSAGRSVAGALNTGLDVGTGTFKYSGLLGAKAGLGAMVGIGAAGATIGAGLAAVGTAGYVDPMSAAAVGATAGAMALPVTGMTAGAIGSVAMGAAKAAPTVGAAALKGAAAASPYVAGVGTLAAENVASKVWNIGSKLVDWSEDAEGLDKVKFTGPLSGAKAGWKSGRSFTRGFESASGFKGRAKAFMKNPIENSRAAIGKSGSAISGSIINGKTILGGVAFAEGIKKAWNTLETAKMGQMTGVTTLTPTVPSYADNSDATGDLVFALNANRRG